MHLQPRRSILVTLCTSTAQNNKQNKRIFFLYIWIAVLSNFPVFISLQYRHINVAVFLGLVLLSFSIPSHQYSVLVIFYTVSSVQCSCHFLYRLISSVLVIFYIGFSVQCSCHFLCFYVFRPVIIALSQWSGSTQL
jgi:hypothetical protein